MALCLAVLAVTARSQEEIIVTYTGQRQLSRAASEAIRASGYTPVISVDAYSLHIVGGQSWFQLDSIRFDEMEEAYYQKYLCWERTHKRYNQKAFVYETCATQADGSCYTGQIQYLAQVEIDRSRLRKLLGFSCYRASYEAGGHSYEVWFTEELPYPDGPFGLWPGRGVQLPLLPGLVLSLTDLSTGSHIEAKRIAILPVAELPDACDRAKDIAAFDKMGHFEDRKQSGIKLSGPEIEVGKWYSAWAR